MPKWAETALTVFAAVMASSGFWAWLMKNADRKNTKTKMLLGLGDDRIIYLCMSYISRGWISRDEYEDLSKYLYAPYKEMKGNGTAERLMQEVDKLPIRDIPYHQQARQPKAQSPRQASRPPQRRVVR
jgi:hypothetical protein